jgi:NAD(P)H-flavin reductase/hemoglobin-like flavoprotein
VSSTETAQNRRRGLVGPWWRVRSWSRDLDTLIRLHRGLQLLDTDPDADQEHLAAPTLLAEPAELTAPEELPVPEELPTRPQLGLKPRPYVLELAPAADQAREPATEDRQQAAGALDTTRAEPQASPHPSPEAEEPAEPDGDRQPDAVAEETAGAAGEAAADPEQTAAATDQAADASDQTAATPDQAADASDQAADAPDPAIAAIKETFRYVADGGDKAVGFFYGQLFLRQPNLRQLFPPAMDEQRDRLFSALGQIVESLSTPEDMAAYLSQLGKDHRKYQVQPEMYEAVGAALLATLRAFARDAFTTEAEEAWTQVYTAGSSLMINAAEEDSAKSPAYWHAEVVAVDHRAPDIAVVTIAPDQPLPFVAGQHITVQTSRWPRVWRPFSIACMPRDDGLLTLHVKAVPGGWVSNALVRYTSPGSRLVLGPPLGTMTLERSAGRDLLCVAGGTGLSPIKAIIEQAVRESSVTRRRIYLYYGARRREELYDLPDLWRLEDAFSGFELIPVTSDDPAFDGMQGNVGRVAARYMPHTDCDAYIAGPPEMVRETIRVLARAGLERDRIHFDDALLARKPRVGTGT